MLYGQFYAHQEEEEEEEEEEENSTQAGIYEDFILPLLFCAS
jgi:hypothetical protein